MPRFTSLFSSPFNRLKSNPVDDDDFDPEQQEEEAYPSGPSRKGVLGRKGGSTETRRLREELAQNESEIRSLKEERSELRKLAEDLERRLEHTRHEYQKQAEQLQREIDQHNQAREQLKARTQELSGAQAFLTRTDTLSGAEVIGMVESLNQEVLQAAAFMADSFAFEKRREESEETIKEMDDATEETNRILGRKMVQFLKSREHRDDPMLVQMALQAGILSYCRRIISARHFDRSRDGTLLEDICREMSNAEDQTISGKWRALTRVYFQRLMPIWKRDPEKDFTSDLAHCIIDVIIVAGTKSSQSEIFETVKGSFRDRLSTIKKMTLRLNKAVVEEVTSGDIEAIYVRGGGEFNPTIMDDGNAVTSSNDIEGQVLCTTDIGLRRYVKRSSSGAKLEWEKTTLLKAKVMLVDSVKEIGENRGPERRYDAFHFLIFVASTMEGTDAETKTVAIRLMLYRSRSPEAKE